MSGYRLSARAAAAEARRDAQLARLDTKSVTLTGFGSAARSDGSNFRTNMVTVADYMDRVSRTNPLGLSATFACVNLIAGTQASLSPSVFRPGERGIRVPAPDHPLHWLLRIDPNYDQTAYEFWEFIGASIELHGNAYARIERSGRRIVALEPVRPDCVTVRRGSRGRLEYEWTVDGDKREAVQDDMLHIRGFGGNATGGASTLSLCGTAFGGALDTDLSARAIFANGVRPSGLLETDIRLDAQQRAEVEHLLQEKYAGSVNSGRPMLLDNGLKFKPLTLNPEDAQLLESRKFSGEEICRIFGVPPAMVGYGDKASNWGTGKEVDVLGFIKFTLRKRLRRIEQALMKQLLSREERQAGVTIEFNLEGLLRGDSQGRAQFYERMTRIGAMTRNEVRAHENLPPVEGGDVVTVQMQDVPLTEAVDGEDA